MCGLIAIKAIKTSISDDFLNCCVCFIAFQSSINNTDIVADFSNIREYCSNVATVAP
jgi:hypothetical protein